MPVKVSFNPSTFVENPVGFQEGFARITDAYNLIHQNPPPKEKPGKEAAQQEAISTKLILVLQQIENGQPVGKLFEEQIKIGDATLWQPSLDGITSAGQILGTKGPFLLAMDDKKSKIVLGSKIDLFIKSLQKSGFDMTHFTDDVRVLIGTEGPMKRMGTKEDKKDQYYSEYLGFNGKLVKAGYEVGAVKSASSAGAANPNMTTAQGIAAAGGAPTPAGSSNDSIIGLLAKYAPAAEGSAELDYKKFTQEFFRATMLSTDPLHIKDKATREAANKTAKSAEELTVLLDSDEVKEKLAEKGVLVEFDGAKFTIHKM